MVRLEIIIYLYISYNFKGTVYISFYFNEYQQIDCTNPIVNVETQSDY